MPVAARDRKPCRRSCIFDRLSRSASSSPSVTRRPLCIPPAGLLACAGTTHRSSDGASSSNTTPERRRMTDEVLPSSAEQAALSTSTPPPKKSSLARRIKQWRASRQRGGSGGGLEARCRSEVHLAPTDGGAAIKSPWTSSQPDLHGQPAGHVRSIRSSLAKKRTPPIKGLAMVTPSPSKDDSSSAPVDNPYVTFLMRVSLKDGKDLVIRDASGSSDPYVKFKYKGKLLYKSNIVYKNLNPTWDEHFAQLIDDPTWPLEIEVFDYDRFAADDFMGAAKVDLSQFRFWQPIDLKLLLGQSGGEDYMGYVQLQLTIEPQTDDEKEQFLKSAARPMDSAASSKRASQRVQVWSSVVNVVLIEAKNLLPTEHGNAAPLPDPYVKFKLGNEKFKSKPASKSLQPKWLEQFDLHIFDEQSQVLEMMVHDKRKDLFMGRCAVDLAELAHEVTHQRWYELEDGAGSLLLLLSITGTVGSGAVADLAAASTDPSAAPHLRNALVRKYDYAHSFTNVRDVGHLTVKVFKAQGLSSADIGGKSDPFCVLELVNARLQTPTAYKTLNPEWNKVFTYNVKDVHSVLEVTVFDEDPNKKVEFLGKVAVPLLKIKNGEKRWYALKDRKLNCRAKGQLLMEMDLVYNPLKASIRTFNPKEHKYIYQEPKFKRQTFMRNVTRVKNFALEAMEVGAFMQSCFSWESPPRSLVAFVAFLAVTYAFQLYMLPVCLLLLFLKSYVYRSVMDSVGGARSKSNDSQEYFDVDDDEDAPDDKDDKKSLKERVMAIQDTLATVQNVLDFVASLMERVRNTLNFTTPFLSGLAIIVLSVATLVLYYVPLRWLVMAWGINKFTKKLRSPHAIPNNELLDFLSRVPCDTEIRQYGEFRPDPVDNPLPNSTARRRVAPRRSS